MTTVFRFSFSRILLFICLLAAASILAVSTFAQDATTGATTRKENIESRKASMKERITSFKDKKKATAAAMINTNLNKINQNRTDQMSKHLERMTAILNKLENRVNERSAIAQARASIASASSAVEAQAEKDYTIQVTSESKVRADAQKQREALHSDLKAVRQLVIDAKQSVANAIRTAKSGIKEGTNSGQQ